MAAATTPGLACPLVRGGPRRLRNAGRPPPEQPSGPVRIGPELFLTLPQPGDVGPRRRRRATGHRALRRPDIRVRNPPECRGRPLHLRGRRYAGPAGDDRNLDRRRRRLPKRRPGFRPGCARRSMLADIVLIYWPEATVRRSLSGGDLQSSTTSRAVYSGGHEVIRVDYQPEGCDPWNGRLQFRNIAWDYALDIQSTVTAVTLFVNDCGMVTRRSAGARRQTRAPLSRAERAITYRDDLIPGQAGGGRCHRRRPAGAAGCAGGPRLPQQPADAAGAGRDRRERPRRRSAPWSRTGGGRRWGPAPRGLPKARAPWRITAPPAAGRPASTTGSRKPAA